MLAAATDQLARPSSTHSGPPKGITASYGPGSTLHNGGRDNAGTRIVDSFSPATTAAQARSLARGSRVLRLTVSAIVPHTPTDLEVTNSTMRRTKTSQSIQQQCLSGEDATGPLDADTERSRPQVSSLPTRPRRRHQTVSEARLTRISKLLTRRSHTTPAPKLPQSEGLIGPTALSNESGGGVETLGKLTAETAREDNDTAPKEKK